MMLWAIALAFVVGLVSMRLLQAAIARIGGSRVPRFRAWVFGAAYAYMYVRPTRREDIKAIRRYVRHRFLALSCHLPKAPPAVVGRHEVTTLERQVVSEVLRKRLLNNNTLQVQVGR